MEVVKTFKIEIDSVEDDITKIIENDDLQEKHDYIENNLMKSSS